MGHRNAGSRRHHAPNALARPEPLIHATWHQLRSRLGRAHRFPSMQVQMMLKSVASSPDETVSTARFSRIVTPADSRWVRKSAANCGPSVYAFAGRFSMPSVSRTLTTDSASNQRGGQAFTRAVDGSRHTRRATANHRDVGLMFERLF